MADAILFGRPLFDLYSLPADVAEECRFVQAVVNANPPDRE